MKNQGTCFIVMPVSTRKPDIYGGDLKHFEHVMEHLFYPAIESVGLTPVSPVASGATLIHADIIRNLESSKLVLCDMSGLNANVFFELGIRTALNLPICLVRDTNTNEVPFDLQLINHHTYKSDLTAWQMKSQVSTLAAHLESSLETSNRGNQLWHFLRINAMAKPNSTDSKSPNGYDEFVSMQRKLDLLQKQLANLNPNRSQLEIEKYLPKDFPLQKVQALREIDSIVRGTPIINKGISVTDPTSILLPEGNLYDNEIITIAKRAGFTKIEEQLSDSEGHVKRRSIEFSLNSEEVVVKDYVYVS